MNGESLSPLCLEQGLTPRGKAQRFDRGLRLRKKENEEAYEGRGVAGALKDQQGLDRQKWGLALQAERTGKARPVVEKPGCSWAP